jgi:hypothetical protein
LSDWTRVVEVLGWDEDLANDIFDEFMSQLSLVSKEDHLKDVLKDIAIEKGCEEYQIEEMIKYLDIIVIDIFAEKEVNNVANYIED